MGIIEKVLTLIASAVLAGCVPGTIGDTMANDVPSEDSIQTVLAENDRLRLSNNIEQVTRIARTECADGYALELYAPPRVSYDVALRDTDKTSPNALFWVLRVPENPPHSRYDLTVPVALDKSEWFAERFVNNQWVLVPKPPSMGTAHASLVDSAVTFEQSEVRGDNVLPTDLRGPFSKVLARPERGRYRIHFAPFIASINGKECSLAPTFWEVNFI